MEDKLLRDICSRLPYQPLVRLVENEVEGKLVGVDLKDPGHRVFMIQTPGFKSPINCEGDAFKLVLYPISVIYQELNGVVPWIEYNRRNQKKMLSRMGRPELEPEEFVEYVFKDDTGKYSKWKWFEGKYGRGATLMCCATFDSAIAFQVGYEMGIDVEGLIDNGEAYEREIKSTL